MSGFDPQEYERTGGNYEIEPTQSGLVIFGQEIDAESQFAGDFGAFCRLNTALHDQAIAGLDVEVPGDYIPRAPLGINIHNYMRNYSNALPNALHWTFIGCKVMQRLGYHLVISQAEDPASSLEDVVAHSWQRPDEAYIMRHMTDAGRPNIALLMKVAYDVFPEVIDKGHHQSWYTDRRLAPYSDTGVLERAFMTGILLHASKDIIRPTTNTELQEYKYMCIELYEKLARDGGTPLGPEEIHGIVEADMRKWIEEHPEQAPLEVS